MDTKSDRQDEAQRFRWFFWEGDFQKDQGRLESWRETGEEGGVCEGDEDGSQETEQKVSAWWWIVPVLLNLAAMVLARHGRKE